MEEERFSIARARNAAGASVTVEKVDGGYIIRWAESVVLPDAKRREGRESYEIDRRSAVREKLEDALQLVQELLQSDRVIDRKWE